MGLLMRRGCLRISDVAETALWMASIRAKETQRRDAIFEDSLAAELCGDRGHEIARAIPQAVQTAWGVVIRTSAIDRLIEVCIDRGVDTVVNLGAGLDTRPYRMRLPSALRWIEVDLPQITEAKDAKLKTASPVCHLERISLDLSNRARRAEALAEIGAAAKNTLLITEGLIPYFSNDQIAALARELGAIPSFRYWIQDFDNAGERRKMPKSWDAVFEAAPVRFQVQNWFEFFARLGWVPIQTITSAEEAERVHRPYPFTFPGGLLMRTLPVAMRRRILEATGAVLMLVAHADHQHIDIRLAQDLPQAV